MALSCSDRPNHLNVPPGIVLPPICNPNRPNCVHASHATNFDVCDVCNVHTAHLLLLDAPPFAPMPQNRLRLSNGHGYHAPVPGGVMVPINQPGVTPPQSIAVVPIAAPFVQDWRTPAEAASNKVTSPPRPNPPFEGFLTRCCRRCEQLIQSEVDHRINAMVTTPPPNVGSWEQPPLVSCTCKFNMAIGGPGPNRLCLSHREEEWNDLVDKKERNDRWLRNIQWDPKTQKLIKAKPRTLRNRVRNRYWRACRCGREIDLIRPPECYICMGCDGWISRVQPTAYPLLPAKRIDYARRKYTFKLRRELSQLGD